MSVQRPCGAPIVETEPRPPVRQPASSGVASNDWSCEDCSTLGVASETGRARRQLQGSASSAHGRGRQSTNGGTRPSGSGRTCRRTTRGESGDSARRAIRSAGARVAMAAVAGGRRSCCRTAGVASSTAGRIRPAGSPAADGPARAGAVSGRSYVPTPLSSNNSRRASSVMSDGQPRVGEPLPAVGVEVRQRALPERLRGVLVPGHGTPRVSGSRLVHPVTHSGGLSHRLRSSTRRRAASATAIARGSVA